MKLKSKFVLKKLGLAVVVLGLAAGAGVGISNLIQNLKDDSHKVALNYEVGGLNETTGKYEKTEETIYTKDKFACYGLKSTLDFDAEIKYQIFYYDILDNYLSCTKVLTGGFSDDAPLNGAYARIEITPTNDEDGKVSFTEKIKYANMLTVKVNKDAEKNLNSRYTLFKGRTLQVVQNVGETVFVKGITLKSDNGVYNWDTSVSENNSAATASTILQVKGGEKLTIDYSTITIPSGLTELQLKVYEFDKLPSGAEVKQVDPLYNGVSNNAFTTATKDVTFKNSTSYVLLSFYAKGLTSLTDTFISQVQGSITIAK